MLLQSLGNQLERKLEIDSTDFQNKILSFLRETSERQDLIGGLTGGLESFLNGTDFSESTIQGAIIHYLTSGGFESIFSNMLMSEDLGQSLEEMAHKLLSDLDVS